jgi:hypothetical protein
MSFHYQVPTGLNVLSTATGVHFKPLSEEAIITFVDLAQSRRKTTETHGEIIVELACGCVARACAGRRQTFLLDFYVSLYCEVDTSGNFTFHQGLTKDRMEELKRLSFSGQLGSSGSDCLGVRILRC